MAYIDFIDGLFYGIGAWDERELWKKAAFRWSRVRKAWTTDRQDVALKVPGIEWTERACTQVEIRQKVAEASHTLSFARDTDFEPLVPARINPRTGKPYALFPFQKAGVEFALLRKDTLLADDMGLGKSPTGVVIVNTDPAARKVLVIATASLKEHWRREFENWKTKDLSVGIAEATRKRKVQIGFHKNGKPKFKTVTDKDVWPHTDVVIVNFDIIGRFPEQIYGCVWDALLVDEAHALCSPESLRTLRILGGSRLVKVPGERKRKKEWFNPIEARRRVFMTGTPMLNKPIDLWPIVHAFDPAGTGRDYEEFGYRYCAGFFDTRRGKWGAYDFTGASNEEEFGRRLRETMMIRRLKQDVQKELPPRFQQIILLSSPEISEIIAREDDVTEALRLYENIVLNPGETEEEREFRLAAHAQERALRLGFGIAMENPDHPSARKLDYDYAKAVLGLEPPMVQALFEEIAQLRREIGIAKVPAVVHWVKEYLTSDEKLVIFAYHTDVIKMLLDALQEFDPVGIWGGVTANKRQGLVDRFQEQDSCRVLIGNYDAAGVGYTMTRAKDVACAEEEWVPTKVSQAFDRVRRIGQTATQCTCFHLVANGSLDTRMAQASLAKDETIYAILDSGDGNLAVLSEGQLEALRKLCAI